MTNEKAVPEKQPGTVDIEALEKLVEEWKGTIPKIQQVWGVNEFLEWARKK